uniref:Protein kinase domain-containing protein n=1 Tax=Globisporangium ultimum (strain ATCC 200006 / CBS 805.95 / DAOM BR144) TaxID=431595 RepID=K3X1A8_GLOUD
MEQLDSSVALRFTVIAAAATASSLVVTTLYGRMRKTAHRATEALFFSVILTDWLFACSGVVAHVMRLVMGDAVMTQGVAGVAVDSIFNLSFLATIVWSPILAAFVLTGGNSKFFVRTSWLVAWTLGGIYGFAWADELQVSADGGATSESLRAARAHDFLRYFETMVFAVSLVLVLVAACVLYGRKFGFLEPSPRLLLQEKLLQYVIVVTLLQLPYMISTWVGRNNTPDAILHIADCLIFSVPVLNAYMYGVQPKCWRITPPTTEEIIDEVNVYAADKVTLEELDGLSDIKFIAEGAAGSVYKARWLGIDVAMKVIKLPNPVGEDKALYETMIQNSEHAFIEEASICARLRHPNIMLFIRAGHYEGKLGILTEYCARGSLKDVLKMHFPLQWRRKVELALHVAKGLTYLHARNPTYIHRDLKGTNILVTDTWQAKLADFGISKVANFVNRTETTNPELTLRNNQTVFDELTSFAGTWRWNAPEILMDPQNCRYSRATDMYSFGMVLWEIATDGAIPFSDVQFDFEVRDRVVREERPQINPAHRVPEMFRVLITKCWAQDPTHRPSATQATVALTALLETMGKDRTGAQSFLTSSDGNSSSIFTSFRGTQSGRGQHRQSHFFGARITNLFRGRFSTRHSTRSSTRSEGPDETFAKYMSPHSTSIEVSPSNDNVAILDQPVTRIRGLSRGFEARLSSLREYDMEANPSDISTAFSSSSAESIMSPIIELPIDAMLEAGGTYIDDRSEDGRSLCSELDSSHGRTDDSLEASNGSSRKHSLNSSGSTWGNSSKISNGHWGLHSNGSNTRSSAVERLRREYDDIHNFDDTVGSFMGSRIVGDFKKTEHGVAAFL